MSYQTLLLAFALMLIFESLLPFLAPSLWRQTLLRLIDSTDSKIRLGAGIVFFLGVFIIKTLEYFPLSP